MTMIFEYKAFFTSSFRLNITKPTWFYEMSSIGKMNNSLLLLKECVRINWYLSSVMINLPCYQHFTAKSLCKKLVQSSFGNSERIYVQEEKIISNEIWTLDKINHEYFTLKRCGNDRFHVVSTWTARDVFVELWHSSSFWRSFTHFWFIILIFYNVLQYSEGFAAAYQKGINYLVCTHFLLLLCARSCAYQGVKNVSCSKYVAYVPNR